MGYTTPVGPRNASLRPHRESPATKAEKQFSSGDRVQHSQFGRGVMLQPFVRLYSPVALVWFSGLGEREVDVRELELES